MSRRAPAVLAAALALAAPASALAQSAGDEQYRDPFAGQDGRQQEPAGTEEDASQDTPAPAPPPAPAPAPSQTAPPTTGSEPVATTAAELPRTGAGAGWVAAIGVLLVAAGAYLRRTATA